MPLHKGKDSKGQFWSWGDQKRYYFNTELGEKRAHSKASKQAQAIGWSKHQQHLKGGLSIRAPVVYMPQGGAVWGLTPEEQAQYARDTKSGKNLVTDGSAIFWDPTGKLHMKPYNP